MSQTANTDPIEKELRQHRLSDLWRPARVARIRDEADTDHERAVLEAILDYNEAEKERWDVLGYDFFSDPTNPPIRGMSYEALAGKVRDVLDGNRQMDTLAGSGPSSGTPTYPVEAADPEDRRQALINLHKADSFDNRRGMEDRADTLRAEAADLLGVDDHAAIDVDTLADHVDLDAAAPDDADDGLAVDTMASYERIEQAEQKRKKAESHRASGREERAAELEAEIDTLLAGLDREELTDADYDALAEYLPRDYDAMAAEYDDPGELATRIDTLESKARAMRSREMDDRVEEVEAELDALRDRAEELTR